MSGLVAFFKGRENVSSHADPLSLAVHAYLKGEGRVEALLFSLLEAAASLSLETPEDVLEFYRYLTAVLFMKEENNDRLDSQIMPLLNRGIADGFWKSFQLQEGYQVLAAFLLDQTRNPFQVRQLEKGAVLQEGGLHVLDRHAPHPRENGELALICLYLGWAWNDEELMASGLKLTEFCLSLCDHEGELFQGMWMKESDYQRETLTDLFSLLFHVASHVALSSKIQVISEALSKKMRGEDPLVALFAKGFQTLIDKGAPFPKVEGGVTLYDQDQSLGFLRYQYGNLSLACSAAGVNTGLGVIHKNEVHITSFGPHYAPLADSTCYGIFRPSNGSRDGFKDLSLESSEDKARFMGWTRIVSPAAEHLSESPFSVAQPGPQWLMFDVKGEKETVDLTVRCHQIDEANLLYIVFFVHADRSVIGERALFPKALDRFQGRSGEILFERGEGKITIKPQFESEMEVIPLAGEDHFWSADFLLAFPIREKMVPHRWIIE